MNLRLVTLFAVGLTSVVVVLGAYTRLVDAGLGCPDWPGCYGFVGVPQTAEEISLAESRFPDAPVEADKAWPEMVHRYFASALGLVLVVSAVLFWRRSAEQPEVPRRLPLFLVALVVLQGAFGAWTVTLKLWPQVVTAHLLGGFTTLALLWLLYLRQRNDLFRLPERVRKPAVVMLVMLVIQIALGGWVSSNYAALACPDVPTCHGEWWPEMDFGEGFNIAQDVGPNYLGGQMDSDARVAIQMVHRIGAVVVTVAGLALFAALAAAGSRLRWLLLGVLTAQLTLGLLNILWVLPLTIATLHNAVGALLLLVLVTVNYRAFAARPTG